MSNLRSDLIKLAHANPTLRPDLLPLLREAAKKRKSKGKGTAATGPYDKRAQAALAGVVQDYLTSAVSAFVGRMGTNKKSWSFGDPKWMPRKMAIQVKGENVYRSQPKSQFVMEVQGIPGSNFSLEVVVTCTYKAWIDGKGGKNKKNTYGPFTHKLTASNQKPEEALRFTLDGGSTMSVWDGYRYKDAPAEWFLYNAYTVLPTS